MRAHQRSALIDGSGLGSCFPPGAVSLERLDSVHWLSSTKSVLVCRTEQKLCSDLAGSSAQCVCLAAAKSQGTELQEERQQL